MCCGEPAQQDAHYCEVDEGEEVNVATVVASCKSSEVFELVEATLDSVACFVYLGVARDRCLAEASWWDHRHHAGGDDSFADLVAIVGLVGNDPTTDDAFQQVKRAGAVMRLAGAEQKSQRP